MDEIILKELEKRILNHSTLNTPLESFNLMYDLLKYNLETLKEFDKMSIFLINELTKISNELIQTILEIK